jgi:outer membrane protein assembly factor BamA
MMPTLVVLALTGSAALADAIQEIVVEKNTKTNADTVEMIAQVDVGDEWTADMGDAIKARLVSSGLFKEVDLYTTQVKGGVSLHLLVEDKHSWVIAPTFYTQPTNTGGGVGFGENNLFGTGQKLLLYGQIATGDSFFVGAWVVPSIGGSRFYSQLDTIIKKSRVIEYAAPTKYLDNPTPVRQSTIDYDNIGLRLGVEMIRGFRLETRLRAAHVMFPGSKLKYLGNLNDQAMELGQNDGDPIQRPGKEGWDISNEWTIALDNRANWYGVNTGRRVSLTYEYAVPALGSDFRYYEILFGAYKAWQVLERHNLVLKTTLYYGHHMPFQQEFTSGGTSMRGYLNDQFRGDSRMLTNIEYSLPLFTISGLSVRGLGFFDSSYTTFLNPDPSQRNYLPNTDLHGLAPFKNSIGVGTRLYLRQIVLPLLGIDFGYGLEARDFQVYLAIGLTD